MSQFKEIAAEAWQVNPFTKIGKEWMLITAGDKEKVNTMTASWGGMGVLWGQNVVYIFVRRSRYTKEFIDRADSFSLTFYPESEKRTLGYLGKVSGRDENKIAKAGYTVNFDGETPYFAEAQTVLICKKLSRHPLGSEGMIDPSLMPSWYSGGDEGNYHDMYVGKIEKVLTAEN